MALYHFSAKVISRAAGSSALASAAYRCAGRLHDERLGRTHDFSNKAGVVHSEVMLPDGAPQALGDREVLWNAVEAGEVRKDAQLAREIELAIPREMDERQGIKLVRDFVNREFVERGMIADLNVHWDKGRDGEPQPHAHVMLTMRGVSGPDVENTPDWQPDDAQSPFGPKVREWNATSQLQQWREAWAEHANARLAELGIEARIDHRSYRDQGIALEPQDKIGAPGMRALERGGESERADEHLEIARRNGERIIAEPQIGLDAITHNQATFTRPDMARLAHRHSVGQEQFDKVLGAMMRSDQLVELGRDGRGEDRFTSRSMIDCELRLARAADRLDARGHGVDRGHVETAMARSAARGINLSREQRDALRHVTRERNLSLVIGYAGSGKSAMLGAARETWEARGYNVRGAALSGIAAENLPHGVDIEARTIASFEHQWARGRDHLGANDVLVIDEAGVVEMERVLSHAQEAGTKVVLVGDAQQLQAIEAGAAFRSLAERHGAIEITEIRRQQEGWQQDATRDLANGRTGEALAAYREHGMVTESQSRDRARAALIEGWQSERGHGSPQSQIILSHTRDEVRTLNDMARDALKQGGQLGQDIAIETVSGERLIGTSERIIFLANDRDLGVKNGTLATVERVSPAHIDARLDDGRQVSFDLKTYSDIDHGYATTIHKAQGVTGDRAHVLATPGLDQHSSYVALSRHRTSVELHYGKDDFDSPGRLARVLGSERPKDRALDYESARERFSATRGYDRSPILDALARDRLADKDKQTAAPERRDPFAGLKLRVDRAAAVPERSPENRRSPFDGLRLSRGNTGDGVARPAAAPPHQHLPRHRPGRDVGRGLGNGPSGPVAGNAALDSGVREFVEAWQDAARMTDQGLPILEYQKTAIHRAAETLDKLQPEAARDLAAAFRSEPALASEAAKGRTQAAIRAMQLETELRTNPEMRADRFVTAWRQLAASRDKLRGWENEDARKQVEGRMKAFAKGIEKDPAMGAALAKRASDLGIGQQQALQWSAGSKTGDIGREMIERKVASSVSHELIHSLGRGRDRGMSL